VATLYVISRQPGRDKFIGQINNVLLFSQQNASSLLTFLYFIADHSIVCRRKFGNKKDRKGLRLHTVGIILTEASIYNFHKGTGPHSMIILR
jgi:hypothetical protein